MYIAIYFDYLINIIMKIKINKNTTYKHIYNILSETDNKILIYELFQKLVKYNKIEIFTKLCKNSEKFSKSFFKFFKRLNDSNSRNLKKINIEYIFKYTYYYKNINIFISFVHTFLVPPKLDDYRAAMKDSIISILYSFLEYIKNKKSSFYVLCINKITTTLALKPNYLDGNCNFPIMFKLLDIYYNNNGKFEYLDYLHKPKHRGYLHNPSIVEIKKINISKFKSYSDKNLAYFIYAYQTYKQYELKLIKTINFMKITNIKKLFEYSDFRSGKTNKILFVDHSRRCNYIIASLFMFTLSYSIKYDNINIISAFVNFLLKNSDYIHFDIVIVLFFKFFDFVNDAAFPLEQTEINIINTNKYLNIILKIINSEKITNDIVKNINVYKPYITKFLNNNHKNSENKIYSAIKHTIINSNVTNMIEYTNND